MTRRIGTTPEDLAAWREAPRAPLPAASSRRWTGWTPEGIVVKPLYTAADIADLPATDTLPGFRPTSAARSDDVRGAALDRSASTRLSRPPRRRTTSTARRSPPAGQGVSVAFDLPTHRGYDSDHPRVVGDVGKAGVAIDSVEDMKILFDGIPLDKVSVSMTMNGAVLPVLAGYVVAAEEQGVPQDSFQRNDPERHPERSSWSATPTSIPPAPSMRIVGDIIEYTARHMPRFNSISISGYHMQEAGANQALELAFTLADGREYVRRRIAKGMDVDAFAGRLSFFWAIGMNFYLEIAKMRAARGLWHRVMQEFAPKSPRSSMLRTHCQTSGWTLTAQDPFNNVVRTTIEAMAAVFGGTQSLHTNALDEAIALPTEFSARIARNTQLVIQEETHITSIVDPWAGSYAMEALTQEMADAAWTIMEEIEAMGGMTKAVQSGWAKLKIEASAAQKQARIDSGQDVIVGVNKYRLAEEAPLDTRDIDNHAVRDSQIERLKAVRATRRRGRRARRPAALTPAPTAGGQPCSSCRSVPSGCAPRSRGEPRARGGLGAGIAPTRQKVSGVYAACLRQRRGLGPAEGRDRGLCRCAGPPAPSHDRQARPGWPRSRRQGGGDRLCRPRLRRRHRPAVPDRRRMRPAGDRERRPCGRRLDPGRRAQDAGAAIVPALKGPGRRDIIVFVGGVDPRCRTTEGSTSRREGHLGPGHADPGQRQGTCLEQISARCRP
jgi:methylmalonyl-CoA mutase